MRKLYIVGMELWTPRWKTHALTTMCQCCNESSHWLGLESTQVAILQYEKWLHSTRVNSPKWLGLNLLISAVNDLSQLRYNLFTINSSKILQLNRLGTVLKRLEEIKSILDADTDIFPLVGNFLGHFWSPYNSCSHWLNSSEAIDSARPDSEMTRLVTRSIGDSTRESTCWGFVTTLQCVNRSTRGNCCAFHFQIPHFVISFREWYVMLKRRNTKEKPNVLWKR
jgi:hypothetical protein